MTQTVLSNPPSCTDSSDCQGDTYSCNGCDLECTNEYSCEEMTFTCSSGECTILCTGKWSCNNMIITASASSSGISINCDQDEACRNQIFNAYSDIDFDCKKQADDACDGGTFNMYSNSQLTITSCSSNTYCTAQTYNMHDSSQLNTDNVDTVKYVYSHY